MNIKNFENFLLNEDKKSINLDDIMKYGGVKINQELKRTRYRYNIGEFVELESKKYIDACKK